MQSKFSSSGGLTVRGGSGANASPDPACFLPKVEMGRITGWLLRRSWLAVVCGLMGVGAAVFYVKTATNVYRASGSVYVGTQAPQVLNIQAVAPEESRDLEQMRSVEQGLISTSLLARVIEEHRLADDPDFAPAGAGLETMVKSLAARVSVELRRGTRIVDLSVEDTKPERAAELVKSLVDEYERWSTRRQQEITGKASDGLTREETRLREKMAQSMARLQAFRESNRIPGLEGGDRAAAASDLGVLTTELAQARAERLRVEAEFEAFRKFDASDPDSIGGIGTSGQAREVLAQVRVIQDKEAEFAVIRERYLEKHPVHKAMVSELALLRKNLESSARMAGIALEKQYRIARENEEKLSGLVGSSRHDAVAEEGLRETYRALSREAEADRTLYEAVSARLKETALAAAVPASVLHWRDLPLVPEKPSSPRKIVALGLGAFGGLFVGFLLMVGVELRDGTIRDAAAAARAAGVPLLARISGAESGDAFLRLRAALSPDGHSLSSRTILFAGVRRGEGRSYCAKHYAQMLAEQGLRTLLIDADTGSPGLSAAHAGEGLGGYLAGMISPAEACFATDTPGLYLLASGEARSDFPALLSGSRFPALLEDGYRWFDRVVIDSSAMERSGDAALIARHADRVCLVVRNRGEDRNALRRAAETIRMTGGSLVGFVWNEIPAGGVRPSPPPVVKPQRPVLPAGRHDTSPRNIHPPAGLLS